MGGILGFFTPGVPPRPDKHRFERALRMLRHRGPDDEGVFLDHGVGLGARLLRIGPGWDRQHMSSEDGTVTAVSSGAIYNHLDLRAALVSLGHRFASSAGSEVLVHGYEQWGRQGLLERLRGMFAFAVWDRRVAGLLLARDRMGMKPLYYVRSGERLYFSSEIRPLLFLSGHSPAVHLEALDAYMQVGFVPGPATMFRGVLKLPPAHYLWAKENGSRIGRYWKLSYDPVDGRIGEESAVAGFRSLFAEAVELHLACGMPVGALLSGGVDSGTNAAFMSRAKEGVLKTVSIGFRHEDFDEIEDAAACARALEAEHHTVTFSEKCMDQYSRALAAMEEPVPGTFMALYCLFRECSERGITVVLTGEGADELLGGYDWNRGPRGGMVNIPLFQSFHAYGSGALRRALLTMQDARRERRMGRVKKPLHLYYRDRIRLAGPKTSTGLLSSEARAELGGTERDALFEPWAGCLLDCETADTFNKLLWLQSRTRLPDFINLMVDRMSMTHSVQARPPFMDHLLWEFCASLPTHLKLRGLPPRCVGKYLLRKAGRGIVPEPSRARPKKGMRIPHARWLAAERLPEWAEEELSEHALKQAGLFEPRVVHRLIRECRQGNEGVSTLIMAVLSMQVWTGTFLSSGR